MTIPPYFPHLSVRVGQEDFINDLQLAFEQKTILLAHAPTGLGKTASALAIAVQHALEHKKKVLFLTNRHTQHRIAIDTIALMRKKTDREIISVDLIGKRWMCSQDVAGLFGNEFNEFCHAVVEKGECEFYNTVRDKKALTVEGKAVLAQLKRQPPLHTEELCTTAREKTMCGYELAMALAKDAHIIVGDYYYLFNPHVQSSFFSKIEAELEDIIVIVDEGHNLPSRIMDMLSNNLSTTMLRNAIIEAKKFNYGGVIHWLQEITRILTEFADFTPSNSFDKEKKITKDQFIAAIRKTTDYDHLIEELELAADEIRKKQRKSFLGGIASFLQAWKGDDEGFARILSERSGKMGPSISLQYLCLDPALITRDIFAAVHAGVIMSGTLRPISMYKDVLGIPKGIEREYVSPFPPENKVTIIVPETSTKFTARSDTMFQVIARKCGELSHLIPGNVAFFFPSYDLRDRICSFLSVEKKTFWEKSEMTKEEKEQLLASFHAERKSGGVLLGVTGANFAEGVDFPGDLLNGVVIVGLPLAKPDLTTKELIAYYERKFGRGWDYGYIYPAMNKCFQSAGRCIRSETDRGAIIYLDERFSWQNYFCCFPREGTIVSSQYARILTAFFG
ncbi:ATP-dependent DNA helicase [Candidatus Woesearchaeota archaeon]|nr:ATP-dependent DNA helicase [Candidatus Woesearchaeota archaeon]